MSAGQWDGSDSMWANVPLPCVSPQEANQTLHTERPDLPECFQRSVLSWLPCVYLWAVCPIYLFYLKKNHRGYIMMSIMNRFKTVRWSCIFLLQSADSCGSYHQLRLKFSSLDMIMLLQLCMIYSVQKKNTSKTVSSFRHPGWRSGLSHRDYISIQFNLYSPKSQRMSDVTRWFVELLFWSLKSANFCVSRFCKWPYL